MKYGILDRVTESILVNIHKFAMNETEKMLKPYYHHQNIHQTAIKNYCLLMKESDTVYQRIRENRRELQQTLKNHARETRFNDEQFQFLCQQITARIVLRDPDINDHAHLKRVFASLRQKSLTAMSDHYVAFHEYYKLFKNYSDSPNNYSYEDMLS